MRSLRVNLGAPSRGLAHAGGIAAPGAGALTVRARRVGGAFSAEADVRTRAEVSVGAGAPAVVAAAFALAARRSPSAAARFAACAMRTRRLDDCLGMSETRIARRG